MNEAFLAIVNPAAGGGRARKLVGPVLARLQTAGIPVSIAETAGPAQASQIARDAY